MPRSAPASLPAARPAPGARRAPGLHAVLDATRQALLAVDVRGHITFANRAACALLGHAGPEALLGHAVQCILASAGQPAPQPLQVTWGERREHTVRRADGATRTLAYVADPLEEGGRRVGAVVSFEDVTEQRQTETALRETRRTLETLMANLPGMAYRCRNTPEWPMEFVSGGSLALTGYPPEAFLGPDARPFGSLMHPDDSVGTWERVQAALAARQPYQLTFRLRTADGRERWAWEQGRGVYAPDGTLEALEGFITDVTERKRIEERLVLSERMAALGTLAAGVAHEVNNPLAFVHGNLDWVAGVLEAGAAPGASEYAEALVALREAREGSARIRDIVNDLRSFTRTEDPAEGEVVDLEAALDRACSLAANEVRHRARLVRERGSVPEVHASEGRLVQVFLNLVVNAAQAIPEGEDATRHTVRVRTSTGPCGHAVVEVQDTGCGITPEALARLFEPFFTTKPVGRGSGLGLSICHNLVTAMGGRLEVESTVGAGSTFRVLLPPAPAAPDAR